MTSRNILSNNYNIPMPSEISKDTLLDYKQSLQAAIYERKRKDQTLLHNAEILMIERYRTVFQEILRKVNNLNVEVATLKTRMDVGFQSVTTEIRNGNYRMSIIENQILE